MAPSDERELLRAWGDGDKGAGTILFQRYYPAIERFFRNKAPEFVQDDLIQATFLAAVAGRMRLRAQTSLRSYLFSIAYKQLCTHYRQRDRQPVAFDASMTTVAQLTPGPSSILAERREHLLLVTALRNIALEHQVILELCYWEGLTAAQVGEFLDIPLGTAKTRIRRARQLLAERVQQLAGTDHPLDDQAIELERWAEQLRETMTESSPGG